MSKRMRQALEYFLLFVWVILTIMTCAAVWNFVSEATLDLMRLQLEKQLKRLGNSKMSLKKNKNKNPGAYASGFFDYS